MSQFERSRNHLFSLDTTRAFIADAVGNDDRNIAPLSLQDRENFSLPSQEIDARRLSPLKPLSNPLDPNVMRKVPQAVYDAGVYGDASIIPFTTAANVDSLVLQRPSAKRILLIIQVQTGPALQINFDADATNANNCLQINAGGDVFFDARVPQNDIHISSSGVTTGIIVYMNSLIENAT